MRRWLKTSAGLMPEYRSRWLSAITSAITVMFFPGFNGTVMSGIATSRIVVVWMSRRCDQPLHSGPTPRGGPPFNSLLLAYGANPENGRDVDQAHTADLHVVPLKLVTTSDQNVVSPPCRNYDIVRDKAVTALHQIEHTSDFPIPLCPVKNSPTPNTSASEPECSGVGEFSFERRLDAPVEFGGLELRLKQWKPAALAAFRNSSGGSCPW